MLRTILLASLVLLATPAFAIYKCEKNGAITYSDEACANGTSLRVDTAPSDASAAKRRAANDEKQLKQIEREHSKQEIEDRRMAKHAAQVRTSKQKKCEKLGLQVKWANEDVATATVKSIDKEKRKARRAQEKYETECGT
jgi:hypothetical protein